MRKMKMTMLVALPALAALTMIDLQPAAAEVYRPWCAQYSGGRGGGGTNCGFVSYEQCMMTATPGSGAYCVRNPWYQAYGPGVGGGQGARTRTR